MKILLTGLCLVIGLSGCASVPMGDTSQDAALKAFAVPADRAGVFIYRNETFGAAVKMDVDIDGKAVGQTAARTYLYKELAPGRHVVRSTAENVDSVEIEARPGTLSYIWQEVKMGVLYARTKLHLVSEAEGRKGVLESKLAATP